MRDHLYVDEYVLQGESNEDLQVAVGSFAQICRRGGLKISADKNKVIMLREEEGSTCDVIVNGRELGHVLEFRYLKFWLIGSGTDKAECFRKVTRK